MGCRGHVCLPIRARHRVYAEHLRDLIPDALAVTYRIDAYRDVHVGWRRGFGLAMRADVLRLFKPHVVIRVRAGKLSLLPQPIEHSEVDSRQELVVIVTQSVEEQGVL